MNRAAVAAKRKRRVDCPFPPRPNEPGPGSARVDGNLSYMFILCSNQAMSGEPSSRRPARIIDSAAKARFLAALRRGERREDAAQDAGFSLTGFYGARRRDPAFAAGWKEALALPSAQERRARAYETRGEVRIASANRRLYQRRRRRHVRFDEARREIYIAHLAAYCDTRAAAEAAGVSVSTVHLHCRTDPVFAEACAEALAEGYPRLEAEALRARLEAQRRLRAAIEAAGASVPAPLLADEGAEFERVMRLLDRRDRKPRSPESAFRQDGRRQPWTFESAIVLLANRMHGLGLLRSLLPREEEEKD
jgi:hypothetical protein